MLFGDLNISVDTPTSDTSAQILTTFLIYDKGDLCAAFVEEVASFFPPVCVEQTDLPAPTESLVSLSLKQPGQLVIGVITGQPAHD